MAILQVLFFLALSIGLALLLGRYMAGVFGQEPHWSNKLFGGLEGFVYKLGGVDASAPMNWRVQLQHLLIINALWFVVSMLVLMNMGWLPLNPDANPSMSWHLAFNTTVSFITNTNLQHYSGESGLSYLGQMTLMLWQFVSAACGMAIGIAVFYLLKTPGQSTNFYQLFVRSLTRVLLPLCLVVAAILVFSGTPMTFDGKLAYTGLQGDSMVLSQGPAAAQIAIKQLGTNGGGFYGVNSAHPLENPTAFSNLVENISIWLIPMAMVFMLGRVINNRRFSYMIFGVMFLGFLALLLPTIWLEASGNKPFAAFGLNNALGAMEGKEMRFGPVASSVWAIVTTCTSNGSVNAMHDSFMPLSGLTTLMGMMINSFFGGIGVGFLNFYVFIILAVFISGLMVGRTPELLGKKIEAREMKIASAVALLHPLLILGGTALASFLLSSNRAAYEAWLANPGSHGFSEMLYEFTSSSANNGSGFEGLGDNTPFWNVACGVVMLLARYLPIIGPVAIAGYLSEKKTIPVTAGTLPTHTATFGLMVMVVIVIVAALSFFPALALGPIHEHFSQR